MLSVAAVLLFAAVASETPAEGGRAQPIALTRVSDATTIRIDGVLDEPVWPTLGPIGSLVCIEPDTLTPAKFPTHARFFYTSRGLYVGFDLEQPKETRVRRLSGRDGMTVNRDTVGFTLDTSGDGRYGYWFEVALGDSVSDGTLLPERQYSNNWDGPWRGASHEHDEGWSAEFFIPWSVVAMPHSDPVRHIGLYMSRKVAQLDERWAWPALPFTQPKFISVLQPVEVKDVAPRQQYNIYPSSSVSRHGIDNTTKYRFGTDIFWRPTTNSQLTATLNPDFGIAESDDIIVNLGATETFFPEKRLFFLEGQEIFVATPRAEPRMRDVGNTGPPYTMVNTRRIGGQPREPTLPTGAVMDDRELLEPIDLYGAAKATGQNGHWRYGFLGASEEDVKFDVELNGQDINLHEQGDDYGIARVLYEHSSATDGYLAFGSLSTVVTNPDRDAIAHGVDGHYLSPRGKVKIDGQLFRSAIEDLHDGYGGFVDMEYAVRQGVFTRAGFEYLDRHIDLNDLGYLERNDSIRLRSSHTRTVSNLSWAKENQFDVRGFVQENTENLFIGAGVFFSDRVTFHSLSKWTNRVSFFPESYDDINSFDNGTYRIEERVQLGTRYDSDSSKPFGYGIGAGFLQENLRDPTYTAEGQLDWRPSDSLSMSLVFQYFDRHGWLVHQNGRSMGTYRADQWQPKLVTEYFVNAHQQLRLSLQWVGIRAEEDRRFLVPIDPGALDEVPQAGPDRDFSISDLSVQLRYRWEIAPLSDVFLVYTRLADQTRALGQSGFQDLFNDAFDDPIADLLVLKIRYRLGS